MSREEILIEVTSILNDVLDRDDIVLEETTKAKDIDGWDSLNHAIFISSIQKHYHLKFKLLEVLNLKNVGDICDIVIEGTKKS